MSRSRRRGEPRSRRRKRKGRFSRRRGRPRSRRRKKRKDRFSRTRGGPRRRRGWGAQAPKLGLLQVKVVFLLLPGLEVLRLLLSLQHLQLLLPHGLLSLPLQPQLLHLRVHAENDGGQQTTGSRGVCPYPLSLWGSPRFGGGVLFPAPGPSGLALDTGIHPGMPEALDRPWGRREPSFY